MTTIEGCLCSFNSITYEKYASTFNKLALDEKKFLISLQQGNPEWGLLGVPDVEKFPGIQWKLLNVQKISKEKNEKLIEKLQSALKL